LRWLLGTVLVLAGFAAPAWAQTVEIELGGGYVVGGGAEDPGPSLPAFDVGVAFWATEHWGVAVRRVEAPGEDLHEPSVGGDRTFLGSGHLAYWTVTARRRSSVTTRLGLELGFGLLLDGRFATIAMLHEPPRRLEMGTSFGGFSLEALLTRELWSHLAIKMGATFDSNFETTNLQPLVVGAIRFD